MNLCEFILTGALIASIRYPVEECFIATCARVCVCVDRGIGDLEISGTVSWVIMYITNTYFDKGSSHKGQHCTNE